MKHYQLRVVKYLRPERLLLFLALGGVAAAQNVDCIEELRVPRYNLSSRRSATGGTVAASILVGEGGRPARIDTVTPDSNLADEVRFYLSHGTTYLEGCAGKLIELKFTFELAGEAEWDPPVFVSFRPPNHFVITSRPRKPNIN